MKGRGAFVLERRKVKNLFLTLEHQSNSWLFPPLYYDAVSF
jgi:hypothetical protein